MNKKVIETIKKVASNKNLGINIDKINYDAPLKENGIDSITAISMIVEIEQDLGVRVPDDKLSSITTLNLLIKEFTELLEKK